MTYLPVALWCLWVLLLGLMVGSFLNVLIARLPLEKSIIWPSSRCFACYRPIRWSDNIPIIGYLRLRGKCRHCGAKFSSRYLWVELGTGLGVAGAVRRRSAVQLARHPGAGVQPPGSDTAFPPWQCWAFFAYHAFLLSCPDRGRGH